MTRIRTATGLTLAGVAATVLLAPAASAETVPSPRSSATPRVPVLEASPVPSGARPSQTGVQEGGGDIEVPAGKADVSAPGSAGDVALVVLAGSGALLLAGGAVVAVSRRRV